MVDVGGSWRKWVKGRSAAPLSDHPLDIIESYDPRL